MYDPSSMFLMPYHLVSTLLPYYVFCMLTNDNFIFLFVLLDSLHLFQFSLVLKKIATGCICLVNYELDLIFTIAFKYLFSYVG